MIPGSFQRKFNKSIPWYKNWSMWEAFGTGLAALISAITLCELYEDQQEQLKVNKDIANATIAIQNLAIQSTMQTGNLAMQINTLRGILEQYNKQHLIELGLKSFEFRPQLSIPTPDPLVNPIIIVITNDSEFGARKIKVHKSDTYHNIDDVKNTSSRQKPAKFKAKLIGNKFNDLLIDFEDFNGIQYQQLFTYNLEERSFYSEGPYFIDERFR